MYCEGFSFDRKGLVAEVRIRYLPANVGWLPRLNPRDCHRLHPVECYDEKDL